MLSKRTCLSHGFSTTQSRWTSTIKVTASLNSRINCPTTLPPPLTLPAPRKDSEYRALYAYKVGKSYLTFYKSGVKQILANRKTVKQIRTLHIDNPLLKPIPGTNVNHKTGQLIEAVEDLKHKPLSRAEFQLMRRHAKDIKKVPVFGLLLAIFGEWLPLFVIFLDPLIPGTVLLPQQVLKRRRKSVQTSSQTPHSSPHGIRGDLEGAGIHDRHQLVMIAKRFGLLGPISKYYPATSILQRIRLHERYIDNDDRLILQETDLPIKIMTQADRSGADASEALEKIDEQELELAVEERGLWSEKQSVSDRLALLNEWLETSHRYSSTKNAP